MRLSRDEDALARIPSERGSNCIRRDRSLPGARRSLKSEEWIAVQQMLQSGRRLRNAHINGRAPSRHHGPRWVAELVEQVRLRHQFTMSCHLTAKGRPSAPVAPGL